MKHMGPPRWMAFLLRSLLPVRDRETVAGDLDEEFCDRRASEQNSARACLWYLIQAISFAPRRCRSAFIQPRMLAFLCVFTALCAGWLGAMDLRLRHTGYLGQTATAAAILLQALLTLGALRFRHNSFLRSLSILGCPLLFWLAAKALMATVLRADMEGYVLVIAVALVYQGSLTLCSLPEAGEPGRLV